MTISPNLIAAVTGLPIHRISGGRYYAADGTEITLTAAQQRRIQRLLDQGVPEVIDADAIRMEAGSRIDALAPDWQQRNATARSVELTAKLAEGQTLTTEEQAERTEIEAFWAQVKAIRVASNAIEQTDPLPAGYPALVAAFDDKLA